MFPEARVHLAVRTTAKVLVLVGASGDALEVMALADLEPHWLVVAMVAFG
jgi:hypothetical protein